MDVTYLGLIMQMNSQIFKKVQKLAIDVKKDLRQKGLVVPKDNGDGTITVDQYTIVKERTGFYSILDNRKEAIVSSINLPQTAAVIANSLALGKWPADDKLVKADRDYGYNLFEETLSKKHAENSLKNNDVDRADILFIKGGNARYKKLQAHQTIINSFEKLRRLR